VHRVKCPNRLNRKGAAGTRQHVVRDGDDGAATLEGLQGSKSGPIGHRIAGLDWKANDTHQRAIEHLTYTP
jgi:hypothetical protein